MKTSPAFLKAATFSGLLALLGGCATALYQPNPRETSAADANDTYLRFLNGMSRARFYSTGGTEAGRGWPVGWCQVQETTVLEDGTAAKLGVQLESEKIAPGTRVLVFREIHGVEVTGGKPGQPYYAAQAPYNVGLSPSFKNSVKLYFPRATLEDAKALADTFSALSAEPAGNIAAAARNKALEDRRKIEEAARAARAKAANDVKSVQERQKRIQAVLQAEKSGLADEAVRNYRGAFHKYLSAFLIPADGIAPDVKPRIHERLLKVSAKLAPPAQVPRDANQLFMQGVEIVKTAVDDEEFRKAEAKFKDALKIAPWWGEAYFHLAQVQERLREIPEAKEDLEWYILGNPKALDLDLAKKMIARLEVAAETNPGR